MFSCCLILFAGHLRRLLKYVDIKLTFEDKQGFTKILIHREVSFIWKKTQLSETDWNHEKVISNQEYISLGNSSSARS